jgi:NADH:ubiquinone oxidoreductase subunit F (NADH-binding)/(2Fe-2S) ferredoxin/Pyruvate/2-oxoacid:ferredoxin oxidoreductase delta subunit
MTKASGDRNSSNLDIFLKEIIQLDKVEYTLDMQKELDLLHKDKVQKPLLLLSMGTAAIVAGANDTLAAIENYIQERNLDVDLVRTGCLGMCNAEPILSFQLPGRNRISLRNITSDKVESLLNDIFHLNIPEENLIAQHRNTRLEAWNGIPFLDEVPFFAQQKRLILAQCGIIDPGSVEEYIAGGGYKAFLKTIRHYTYKEICDIVEESGLRGRSGSGYITGTKWKIAYHTPSDQKYLICNAEESDPGAFMDRAVMEGNPHLLLEGMAIASYAIGATKAIIYIRSEYEVAISQLEKAIFRLKELGIIGHNIFGSGFNLDISVRRGPGAFVCGEETALIRSLEGKRGMPKTKPPYPASTGLHKKPTIINNVETLSNIPLIIAKGPKWFKETGTEENYGTKIFALSGRAANPGLIEVPFGTNLQNIVFNIAGGVRNDKELKAVHIGGPSGTVLPPSLLDIPVTYESMMEISSGIGSGGMVFYDDSDCILDMVKYFMNFMEKQSCGKCIPCREGTRRMAEILESITKKPQDENNLATLERFKGVMQLESLADVMKDTSLCGLGQNAPNPVLSTLKYFREEYEEHIFDRKCRSNVCTELRTYYIDVEACTGCSVCAKKCPVDAIIGTALHPYFIVEEKCTGCGLCFESCKFSAIFYK